MCLKRFNGTFLSLSSGERQLVMYNDCVYMPLSIPVMSLVPVLTIFRIPLRARRENLVIHTVCLYVKQIQDSFLPNWTKTTAKVVLLKVNGKGKTKLDL